jgi:hypothetical protein
MEISLGFSVELSTIKPNRQKTVFKDLLTMHWLRFAQKETGMESAKVAGTESGKEGGYGVS